MVENKKELNLEEFEIKEKDSFHQGRHPSLFYYRGYMCGGSKDTKIKG